MPRPTRCASPASLAAALVLTAGATAAPTNYSFTLASEGTSFDATLGVTTNLAGTLRGNYNTQTNPTGTRTRLGLFTRCDTNITQNDNVPFSAVGGANGQAETSPTGSFSAAVNTAASTIVITGLTLDLVGEGTAPSVPVSFNFTIGSNFVTCNPNSTFIAATVPIPFGSATLTALAAAQTATPATGTLTQTAPNTYTFAAAVEVTLTGEFDLSGNGSELAPQVIILPVTGTLTLAPDGSTATASIGFGVDFDQVEPGPTPGPTDLPLPIPTILPPGNTANLLATFNLTNTGITIEATGSATASGSRALSPADFNRDGTVNTADITAFLSAWFADRAQGEPPYAADFNADGMVTTSDITAFLSAWFAARGGG